VQSPSQAFLVPADVHTKGGAGQPQLGSTGQHLAACAKDGAVPCRNPSLVAQSSLPVAAD